MKKIAVISDVVFGVWLLFGSLFVFSHGGRGSLAWPLIPFSLVLLSIVSLRLITKKGHHFGSAAWYLLAFLSSLIGIFEDYSYMEHFEIARMSENIAIALVSFVLLGLHIRLWSKGSAARQSDL